MPTTLPDLLSSFTAEFNRLLEDRWRSEIALRETREQLAVALYRVDAATRVVARLTRERDDLLHRLASSIPAAPENPEISRALPAEVAGSIETLAQQLQTSRREAAKTRKSQAPSKDTVGNFCEISDSPVLHAHGGISALRLQGRDVVASVGGDLHVHVLRLNESEISPDLAQSQALASIRCEGATVTSLAFHPTLEILFTADEEGVIAAWRGQEEISRVALKEPLISVSVHPSGRLLLAVSPLRVQLLELSENGMIGNPISEYRDLEGPVTAAGFHPDGLLMAVALEISSGSIVIFDVRSGDGVARLQGGHQARVRNFRFGENGYMLVSVDEAGTVVLWDLRKSSIIAEFSVGNLGDKISVAIDESCQYIATAAGQNFRLFGFTGKTEVSEICSFETRQEISDMLWLPGHAGLLLAGNAGKLSLVASA